MENSLVSGCLPNMKSWPDPFNNNEITISLWKFIEFPIFVLTLLIITKNFQLWNKIYIIQTLYEQ